MRRTLMMIACAAIYTHVAQSSDGALQMVRQDYIQPTASIAQRGNFSC